MIRFRNLDRGAAAVLLSAVAFGTYGVLGKSALDAGFAPFALLFWRFALAALVLWFIARVIKEPPLPAGVAIPLAALGVAYATMSATYLHTVQYAGVSYAVLLFYAYPAVVALIERIHGKPLRIARVAAVLFALGGVALLVYGPRAAISPANVLVGASSAVAYGAYIFYGSDALRALPVMRATALILGSASAALLPFAIAGGLHVPPPHAIAWLVVIVLCATTLPVALLSIGMPKTGAAKASILGTLEPLTAVALAAAFLGEHLRGPQIAGALLIAAATIL